MAHKTLRRSMPRLAMVLVATCLNGLVSPLMAHASSIEATRQEIATLSAQLNAQTKQSEIMANQYDAAAGRLQTYTHNIQALQGQIAQKRTAIAATTKILVRDVVRSFVAGASAAQTESLFNQSVTSSDARQLYAALAVGNLDQVRAQLNAQQRALHVVINQVAQQRQQAIQQTTHMHDLLAQNQALQNQTQQTLNVVTARLRTQIIAYEVAAGAAAARARDTYAEEQAVNAASQVGGQAAANEVIMAIRANTPPVIIHSPATSAQGNAALRAAESQVGVPYVWGGETPGQGFDCSGLVQWAWAQAGVSIPRTTQEQWAALPHVSMSNLEPGDLIYYYNLDGDNQVDHVIMYVGSGTWGTSTIFQASHTGAPLAYGPLWTFGLIGAARP